MNLKDFLENLNFIKKTFPDYENLENINVVITTSESSIGGRSCVDVYNVHMGFDWEHGQLRIEPANKLLKRQTREIAKVIKQQSGGISYWGCSYCGRKIAKDDRFCKECGRKLEK